MRPRIRVIHCGTGVAGRQALRAILQNPGLELVGLLVHGEAAEGRRAAELAGLPDGPDVRGTRELGALLATPAEAVVDMLLLPDAGRIAAFLAAGKNVVTTAGLIFPGWQDAALRERLARACTQGRSSFHATGINPGWVDEILPLTMSALCRRLERVHVREYADCAKYPAPHILSVMGFGRSAGDVAAGRLPDLAVMRDFFAQSIAALAHGLGGALDEIRETREFAYAPCDYAIAAGPIARGTIAGQRWRWSGIKDGAERIVQETYWTTRPDLGEGWPAPGEDAGDTQWQVTLEGTPSLRCTFEPRHSFLDAALAQTADYNPSALATAMAAVNRIPALCAAPPGLLTSVDLPLPRASGVRHG